MAFGVRRYKDDIKANTDFYACPLCEAVFTKKQEYKQHLQTQHPNENFGKKPA